MKNFHTAKYIRSNCKGLSTDTYKWDVPVDLCHLSLTKRKTFIGIGKWKNTRLKYVCIAQGREVICFEEGVLKEIVKAFKKGGL